MAIEILGPGGGRGDAARRARRGGDAGGDRGALRARHLDRRHRRLGARGHGASRRRPEPARVPRLPGGGVHQPQHGRLPRDPEPRASASRAATSSTSTSPPSSTASTATRRRRSSSASRAPRRATSWRPRAAAATPGSPRSAPARDSATSARPSKSSRARGLQRRERARWSRHRPRDARAADRRSRRAARHGPAPARRHGVHHRADDQPRRPRVRLLDDGWTVVTADGSLSAQFEHTVLVARDGCEVLTLP